jgi:hypothetical protein
MNDRGMGVLDERKGVQQKSRMRENNCRETPTKEQFSMWRRRSGNIFGRMPVVLSILRVPASV